MGKLVPDQKSFLMSRGLTAKEADDYIASQRAAFPPKEKNVGAETLQVVAAAMVLIVVFVLTVVVYNLLFIPHP